MIFNYSHEMDVKNFLKCFTSRNNPNPTKLGRKYLEIFQTPTEPHASMFLAVQGIRLEAKAEEISRAWRKIEHEALKRMRGMFGFHLNPLPSVYITTETRCTYCIENNYFFVSFDCKESNSTIVHELFHFYTWHAFHNLLREVGVSKEKYNDIKESLTEILNTDFTDLLGDNCDTGYPQHEEMRCKIRQMRRGGRSIKEIVVDLST